MRLLVETEGFDSHYPDDPSIARSVAAALVFAAKHLPTDIHGQWSIVLKLLDVDEICELHATYFNDPTPTDVITFPSGELDGGAGSGHLGDVAICADVAARQASDLGHPEVRELAFLGLHGLLHLIGYRDRYPEERDQMLALQEQLLTDFEREYGAMGT